MSGPRSASELQQITTFADELPVAIWVGRVPSGECVYINGAFRHILGMEPPQGALRGNYVGPYSVHTHDGQVYPEEHMPYERALAARASVEVDDMVIHRHDGGRTYLRVYARPLFDEGGEITHVVEAFTDISREVVSRRAQLEREVQLRQAQRMDSLGSLAGGIAHDFNNLLTVIKAIATHLPAKVTDPEVREALQQIDDVTESAASLTRALLGFARRGKNLEQRVCLNELVSRVAEIARRTVGRQIDVVCAACEGSLEVEGDPSQLEQLFMNLVVNARDAMEGPGRLTIRTAPHEVTPEQLVDLAPGRYAMVEVQDTGSGIAEAVRERIFEPYFTTKLAGAVKGTGLGLATVFGIVEGHRGWVGIVDTGRSGTTMRVLLPLVHADEQARTPVVRAPALQVPGRGRVLLVDDEELVLRVTARALRDLGYQVMTATSGAAAVDAYQRERFDAVVLDLVMPVMDGRATFSRLRSVDPNVRVLLITGFGLNYEAQGLLDLGVRAFVAKPFSIAELSATLHGMLEASTSAPTG